MRPKELDGYKFYKGKDPIKPLTIGWRVEQGRVARHWNMLPNEFRTLPQDEAAELHALWRVERMIESYEASESSRRMDKDIKPSVSSGNKSGR